MGHDRHVGGFGRRGRRQGKRRWRARVRERPGQASRASIPASRSSASDAGEGAGQVLSVAEGDEPVDRRCGSSARSPQTSFLQVDHVRSSLVLGGCDSWAESLGIASARPVAAGVRAGGLDAVRDIESRDRGVADQDRSRTHVGEGPQVLGQSLAEPVG